MSTLTQKSLAALDLHLLFEVRSRMADVLGTPVDHDERNPVLPRAVFEALGRACGVLAGTVAERHAL